jgi:hypothetical protein
VWRIWPLDPHKDSGLAAAAASQSGVKPPYSKIRSRVTLPRFKVDVFCGYRSNCDHAGFEVSHKCLELFVALEVPFGLSVIVV